MRLWTLLALLAFATACPPPPLPACGVCEGANCTDDDSLCTAETHCDDYRCHADLNNGDACDEDSDCSGGHCGNGRCCASGDCCVTTEDCPATDGVATVCEDPASCSGKTGPVSCGEDFRCHVSSGDSNDSACSAPTRANDCGAFADTFCNGQVDQSPPTCATTCTGPADCDPQAWCDPAQHTCVARPEGVTPCQQDGDCAAGQSCTDSVCCSTPCKGGCEACNLPGSVGTCAPLAAGADPKSHCAGVACNGHYAGWTGQTCLAQGALTDDQVACNGQGACQSPDEACALHVVPGPGALTCGSCQTPHAGSCAGTVPGDCDSLPPGSQSCGVGACRRTVAECSQGQPVVCTPGAPASETCNGVDDNCDGITDNGAFADSKEPASDSCIGGAALELVGSQNGVDNTAQYSGLTLYPSGDADHYTLPLKETDATCGCGGASLDEDYKLDVTVTAPAVDLEVCLNTVPCTWPTGYCFPVSAFQELNLTMWLDGGCGPTPDGYVAYLRVRPLDGNASTCQPYALRYSFESGFCR